MNYKQQNCKLYGSERGCRYGNKCRFSHSNPNSVPLCHHYNNCVYGNKCKYRHINFNFSSNTNNNDNIRISDTAFTTLNKSYVDKPYNMLSLNPTTMNTQSLYTETNIYTMQIFPKWQTLSPFPCTSFGVPVIRSNGEIIIAPSPRECRKLKITPKLFKYDVNMDKYIEWIKYPENYWSRTHWTNNYNVLIDKKKDLLYIFNSSPPNLLIIDLQNETTQYVELQDIDYYVNNGWSCYINSAHSSGVIINHSLHFVISVAVMGTTWNQTVQHYMWYHYIYDINTKQFKLHHAFTAPQPHRAFGYIESQNKALLIGSQGTINEYDVDKGKWRYLPFEVLPLPVEWMKSTPIGTGYIVTRDYYNNYLITFGGKEGHKQEYTDLIYIVNLDIGSVAKSYIKCPVSGLFYAFLMDNYEMKKKVIDGYFRKCYFNPFGNVAVLPHDINNLICHFFLLQYVHLMKLNNDQNKGGWHWKILLKEIMNHSQTLE